MNILLRCGLRCLLFFFSFVSDRAYCYTKADEWRHHMFKADQFTVCCSFCCWVLSVFWDKSQGVDWKVVISRAKSCWFWLSVNRKPSIFSTIKLFYYYTKDANHVMRLHTLPPGKHDLILSTAAANNTQAFFASARFDITQSRNRLLFFCPIYRFIKLVSKRMMKTIARNLNWMNQWRVLQNSYLLFWLKFHDI